MPAVLHPSSSPSQANQWSYPATGGLSLFRKSIVTAVEQEKWTFVGVFCFVFLNCWHIKRPALTQRLSQLSSCEGRVKPWISDQLIPGPHRNKQLLALTRETTHRKVWGDLRNITNDLQIWIYFLFVVFIKCCMYIKNTKAKHWSTGTVLILRKQKENIRHTRTQGHSPPMCAARRISPLGSTWSAALSEMRWRSLWVWPLFGINK